MWIKGLDNVDIRKELYYLYREADDFIFIQYPDNRTRDSRMIHLADKTLSLIEDRGGELYQNDLYEMFRRILLPLVDICMSGQLSVMSQHKFVDIISKILDFTYDPFFSEVWIQLVMEDASPYLSSLYMGDDPVVLNSMVICG